jgi:hypothetical protein
MNEKVSDYDKLPEWCKYLFCEPGRCSTILNNWFVANIILHQRGIKIVEEIEGFSDDVWSDEDEDSDKEDEDSDKEDEPVEYPSIQEDTIGFHLRLLANLIYDVLEMDKYTHEGFAESKLCRYMETFFTRLNRTQLSTYFAGIHTALRRNISRQRTEATEQMTRYGKIVEELGYMYEDHNICNVNTYGYYTL